MLRTYETEQIEKAVEGLDSLDRINFFMEVEELAERKRKDTRRAQAVKKITGCFTSLALEPNKAGELLDIIDGYVNRDKDSGPNQ